MKTPAFIFVVALAFGLSSCGGDDETPASPPQVWHGVTISIDTRPSPPQSGMTEILVLATAGKHHQPAYDLLVNLRTADGDGWVQAIEDGQTGVYRRAVRLEPGERSTVQMQVKRGDTVDILRFPLTLAN